ncbi:DMT family transporter, partial [Methylacidiphilum caldifontis]|uniref:DMT family transporter n=1 Tax=Methylacidiphilum caldifontis TaxID=2795386 RepID=UPI001ABC83C0
MNLIWAIGYPVTTVALHEGMPPSLLAVVRLVGAFLMLWPQLRGLPHLSGKLWGFCAVMGVTGFTLPMWLQIRGIGGTDAAIGAISIALEPLLTVLLAAQITGQRVHRGQQVALGLA